MTGMGIQDRYDDISALSGLSEDIIRRVYKATRTSLAKSLKKGERATLPGICTITPEIKHRIELGGTSMSSAIKLKAKASPALENELEKLSSFVEDKEQNEQDTPKLRIESEIPSYRPDNSNIITTQISALL